MKKLSGNIFIPKHFRILYDMKFVASVMSVSKREYVNSYYVLQTITLKIIKSGRFNYILAKKIFNFIVIH